MLNLSCTYVASIIATILVRRARTVTGCVTVPRTFSRARIVVKTSAMSAPSGPCVRMDAMRAGS